MPAKCLPVWAREFLDEWRVGSRRLTVSIDDQMEHRRSAFYRLYSANDADVRAMWRHAENSVAPEWRNAFILDLILATDSIFPEEALPVYGSPPSAEHRLRTREQRHARKLAKLLQLLRVVTPPRCKADKSRINEASCDVEYLIIFFDIGPVPRDYYLCWRMTELGVEYTMDSKRGWMQHRRASDLVRGKVVNAARTMAALPGATQHTEWLLTLADELEALPSMKAEHVDEIDLQSQKAGYLDWLAVAYSMTKSYSSSPEEETLRIVDWAVLARVVAGAGDVTPDDISHAISRIRGHCFGSGQFLA